MENGIQTSKEPIRVALDPQVVFSRREVGGKTTYIAHHPALGKYFKLGPEEYHLVSLLDGSRSVTEILQQVREDGLSWEAKEVAEFIAKLVASRLASRVGKPAKTAPQVSVPSAAQARYKAWFHRLPALLSLMISQRIPLLNGHEVASRIEKRIGFVFSSVGMVYWCGLVASGLMIVSAHHQDFTDELRRLFDPSLWFFLLGMWVGSKVIHEIGHAAAARYHDVQVGKMGIMFFFLAPLAYVDVTDAWKLKSRWSRMQIALAGIYFELAVAAIAAWAWWLLPDGYAKHLAAQCFLIAGPATLLVNANPLLRLDGYYVVSDLTEIPNLRMHGRNQLAGLLEKLLLKTDPPQSLLSGWRRKFATVHAACSVLFQIVWMGGLIIGVSIWARGLGMILALAAILLWAVLPLSRWTMKVWASEPSERWYLNEKRQRLLCYAILLLIVGQYLCVSHSPFSRRVPVVVRFHDEQIARATADAFVRNVHVTRGQRVNAGMLMVELSDPELVLQRDTKADELRIVELKAVQFRRQGELSQSAAEAGNAESLRRQLKELEEQISGLNVVAQRNGLVVGSNIENLLGRFVKKGDEILRVCDPQEKEILASVAEDDMQAYQNAASQSVPAKIRLRGGASFTATPASLRPRARRSLPHPALSAVAGGPLAVEPSPDEHEKVRVIEPRMASLTQLDPLTSVSVRAGQVGTMTISDNRSLVTRLFDALKE